jgi:predicted permease
MPSSRAVSSLSEALPLQYSPPFLNARRAAALSALPLGVLVLGVALAPHIFGVNAWTVSATGIFTVLLGAAAMQTAPWLGSLARVSATLGMTMGLAAATLMLVPFI